MVLAVAGGAVPRVGVVKAVMAMELEGMEKGMDLAVLSGISPTLSLPLYHKLRLQYPSRGFPPDHIAFEYH